MPNSLHRHTPTLTVIDPRSLPVRSVGWYRAAADDVPAASVTAQRFDVAGRMVESRDPRLFGLGEAADPNIAQTMSMSSQVLASRSVDAGWRSQLLDEAGAGHLRWDGRGSQSRTEYDVLRRPLAIFEQAQGTAEYCAERFVYGDAEADPTHNLRHAVLRHDDPAGSRLFSAYALTALAQDETQHFLASLDRPDWPVAVAERDALLEPGPGALTRWDHSPWAEPLALLDAKGNRQAQQHTVDGQLAAVTLQRPEQPAPLTLVSDIRYNALGFIERQLAGNGVESTATYDPASGYLTGLRCTRNGDEAIQDLQYTYDRVGNVLSCADLSLEARYRGNRRIEPICTYAYDSLYKLTIATGREQIGAGIGPQLPSPIGLKPTDDSLIGAYTRRYQYDAGGNLIHMQHSGQEGHEHALSMVVSDRSNKALPWREGLEPGGVEQGFDSNGNLKALQPGQALDWDLRNQLSSVTRIVRAEGTDDVERYIYGGGGKRLRKHARQQAANVTHVAETRYLPGIELHENSATGARWQVLIISAGRATVRLLHWDSTPPEGVASDPLYYGFGNHLGSATLETDQAGQLSSREEYYPFGGTALLAARNEIEVSYKTLRYSGKERDATGLYYYGFRYLAPWLGRWINPDPSGIQDGLNLFAFVGNNPVSRVDLQGLTGRMPGNPAAPLFTDEERAALDRFDMSYFGWGSPEAEGSPGRAASPALSDISNLSTELRMLEAPASPALSDISNLSTELRMLEARYSPARSDISSASDESSLLGPLAGLAQIPVLQIAPGELEMLASPATSVPSGFSTTAAQSPAAQSPRRSPVTVPLPEPVAGHSRTLMERPAQAARLFHCAFPNCEKSYPSKSAFSRHRRSHRPDQGRTYVCLEPDCGKAFARADTLKIHRAVHTGVGLFSCSVAECGRLFPTRAKLNDHNKLHTRAGPFQCPTCRGTFPSRHSLKSHIQIHPRT